MAYTTVSWPSGLYPARVSWGYSTVDVVHRSPGSRLSEVIERGSPLRTVELDFDLTRAGTERLMRALVARLRGSGRAMVPLFGYWPEGHATGTLSMAASASAGATVVSIDGAAAGTFLEEGDLIQLGQHVYTVAAAAVANGVDPVGVTLIEPLQTDLALAEPLVRATGLEVVMMRSEQDAILDSDRRDGYVRGRLSFIEEPGG